MSDHKIASFALYAVFCLIVDIFAIYLDKNECGMHIYLYIQCGQASNCTLRKMLFFINSINSIG